MMDVVANKPARELAMEVPTTLDAALDPEFLSLALGREVASVETLELLKTRATKVRFAAKFDDGTRGSYCLKGLLDVDEMSRMGGSTCVLEGDFYLRLAASLPLNLPDGGRG